MNKVDIYKSNGIAVRLGVDAVPAAVAIKNGQAAGSLTKGLTVESMEKLLGL